MRHLIRRSRHSRGCLALLVTVALTACGGVAAEPDPAAAPTTGTSTSQPPSTTAVTATTPSVSAYPTPEPGVVARWVPVVVATRPHDDEAFTQGLVVLGDTVYESTGLYGESTLRIVDRVTGDVERSIALAADVFGEGIELVGDRLIQLTWREETAIVWDAATFEEVSRFGYDGEGWGLCHDGERLVMSNGTPTLTFRDAETFAVTGEVTVERNGVPVDNLNELECAGGLVFANVWTTTDIVVVDPATGEVTAVIDAAALDTVDDGTANAVLNGIAYDPVGAVFLVTGKLWPTLYEVRFVAG